MHRQMGGNAVGAIRVSSTGQSIDGDSPDDQKVQIERQAAMRGMKVIKYFLFLESASKDLQPMQEAIDFCKEPKNDVQCMIIKSIDRFTRGGGYVYGFLKEQLDTCDVSLIDIFGVISGEKVNTLEHLGVKYKWSEYSPSKKTEMLEAERASDEIRDIMSRMIGAEIRYARLGYWVRMAPYGFVTDKIETQHGKRTILLPHEAEGPLVIKMFKLRARGNMEDREIVAFINKLGYKSRVSVARDKYDRTRVVSQRGGQKLSLKVFWRCIQNPVYAGVNSEKWTQDKPVRCQFKGLVSVELFNKANRGKVIISQKNGEVNITRREPPDYLVNKGVKNEEFPYKRYVMCTHCEKPLYGSASRGKLGKYYPAYHCNKRGHYFRVPKTQFEDALTDFVKKIKIAPEYIDALEKAVITEWEKRQAELGQDEAAIDKRIADLESQSQVIVNKLTVLTHEVSIKHMEKELVKVEDQIAELRTQKDEPNDKKSIDMKAMLAIVRFFLEHLQYLVLQQGNPLAKASYFGLLFNTAPTYKEIESGTPQLNEIIDINKLFIINSCDSSHVAGEEGFEPPHAGTKTRCLTAWPLPIT